MIGLRRGAFCRPLAAWLGAGWVLGDGSTFGDGVLLELEDFVNVAVWGGDWGSFFLLAAAATVVF